MTVKDLQNKLKLEILCKSDRGMQREVKTGIVCDIPSYVMDNAPEDAAWLTVSGDIHSVAVCLYSNISVMILTGSEELDDDAKQKAEEYSVPILRSYKSSFQLAYEINELLNFKN